MGCNSPAPGSGRAGCTNEGVEGAGEGLQPRTGIWGTVGRWPPSTRDSLPLPHDLGPAVGLAGRSFLSWETNGHTGDSPHVGVA